MKRTILALTIFSAVIVGSLARGPVVSADEPASPATAWDARAAAAYLDGRQAWWMTWPTAARDHDTQCVSCHTALPYALARPMLRAPLAEHEASAPERKMLEHITKRVRMWKEVEPFYPDQLRGLPKTSESRGTEAILNAVILSTRDAHAGALSDDARQAFDNLWPLQFKAGEQAGAWAWLDFHNEPWEAPGSQYFGNSLAAIAIGSAPGGYAATPAIADRVKPLATYLRGGAEKEDLLNRAMILWASSKIPGVLTPELRQHIVDDLVARQQSDGGWATAALVGGWKRHDATPLDMKTDGYATGLVTFVLQQAGQPASDPVVSRGRAWLVQHQDRATGMWTATSVNKERDPASDIGKFMSDAATSYAVLALSAPDAHVSDSAR
jgi:squalene-hopene/tetraprenyl-beta-curcumene cyclase